MGGERYVLPICLLTFLGCTQDPDPTDAESGDCDPPHTLPAYSEWRDPSQECAADRQFMGCVPDHPCGVGGASPEGFCVAAVPVFMFCGHELDSDRYYCSRTSRETGAYVPELWGSALWIQYQADLGLLDIGEGSSLIGGTFGRIPPPEVRACWPEFVWPQSE